MSATHDVGCLTILPRSGHGAFQPASGLLVGIGTRTHAQAGQAESVAVPREAVQKLLGGFCQGARCWRAALNR